MIAWLIQSGIIHPDSVELVWIRSEGYCFPPPNSEVTVSEVDTSHVPNGHCFGNYKFSVVTFFADSITVTLFFKFKILYLTYEGYFTSFPFTEGKAGMNIQSFLFILFTVKNGTVNCVNGMIGHYL